MYPDALLFVWSIYWIKFSFNLHPNLTLAPLTKAQAAFIAPYFVISQLFMNTRNTNGLTPPAAERWEHFMTFILFTSMWVLKFCKPTTRTKDKSVRIFFHSADRCSVAPQVSKCKMWWLDNRSKKYVKSKVKLSTYFLNTRLNTLYVWYLCYICTFFIFLYFNKLHFLYFHSTLTYTDLHSINCPLAKSRECTRMNNLMYYRWGMQQCCLSFSGRKSKSHPSWSICILTFWSILATVGWLNIHAPLMPFWWPLHFLMEYQIQVKIFICPIFTTDLWPNISKTNDISICLTFTLSLELRWYLVQSIASKSC